MVIREFYEFFPEFRSFLEIEEFEIQMNKLKQKLIFFINQSNVMKKRLESEINHFKLQLEESKNDKK